MITKEQVERLRGSKDFVEFLDYIKECRETDITGLVNAETDKLHQRAGAIGANQAVLDLFDYATIKRYWE